MTENKQQSLLATTVSSGRIVVGGYRHEPRGDPLPRGVAAYLPRGSRGGAHAPEHVLEPRFVAVVDIEKGYVFSVVTDDYVLVTNQEALEHAKQAFGLLFRSVDVERDMEVLDVQAPSTRSSCQVDLIHREYRTALWDSEVYVPYLRMTNSYNSTHALHFHLGFARAADGVRAVFDTLSVHYKKAHTQKDLGGGIKFSVDESLLAALIARFTAAMNDLRRFKIPLRLGAALIVKALGITVKESAPGGGSARKAVKRSGGELKAMAVDRFHEAADEHGTNAYAVYVAAMALATWPPGEIHIPGGADTLQRRVGAWAERFPAEANREGFDLSAYVAKEKALPEGP